MSRQRLGDVLLGWGSITPEDLRLALEEQRNSDGKRERLGRVLVRNRAIDEATLATALGTIHGMPAINLETTSIDPQVARILPRSMTERYALIPVRQENGRLTVALADPVDVVALDELKSRFKGQRIDTVVAPEGQIRDALLHAWGDETHREVVERFVDDLDEDTSEIADQASEEDVGAVGVVNQILSTAARRRASDIHVEPQAHAVRVRIRIDGILREMMRLPASSLPSIVTRMKIISGLSVMERRIPQDGRTTVRVDGKKRDIRVSSLPTIHGEKIVMRILPSQHDLPELMGLGLTEWQSQQLREVMERPQGFALVTGPTGAGKSNTLYSAITASVHDDRNIMTLEDPVEMELEGVNQVQVNENVGLTFEKVLRAALRQDPDVIMVGEVRDLVTGQMAVRAALTGHLVLSTLHTLDAPSSVRRLLEMGIPTYLVASSLTIVIAQRLVRRPCKGCLQPDEPDPDTRRRLQITPQQAAKFVKGTGCQLCDGTGYKGRIGVFEMLMVDSGVREAILNNVGMPEMRAAARHAGWVPLIERGVEMAAEQLTTAEELLRTVTGEVDESEPEDKPVNPINPPANPADPPAVPPPTPVNPVTAID